MPSGGELNIELSSITRKIKKQRFITQYISLGGLDESSKVSFVDVLTKLHVSSSDKGRGNMPF